MTSWAPDLELGGKLHWMFSGRRRNLHRATILCHQTELQTMTLVGFVPWNVNLQRYGRGGRPRPRRVPTRAKYVEFPVDGLGSITEQHPNANLAHAATGFSPGSMRET